MFVRPSFFFKYPGFEWVHVWGPTGLYIHFGILITAALGVALGLFYRASLIVFVIGFTWIQLMDQTNYLNHYYLVILVGGILLFLPADRAFSLDARRNPQRAQNTVPAWTLYLLRYQIALVYIFAAIAKVGTDWVLHAQPLSIWLSARTDLPYWTLVRGNPVAYAMSWGGLVYDATIVGFLLWSRTRVYAYGGVGFHAMTWALFDIGMFPFIMAVFTTIFFTRLASTMDGRSHGGRTEQIHVPVHRWQLTRLVSGAFFTWSFLYVTWRTQAMSSGMSKGCVTHGRSWCEKKWAALLTGSSASLMDANGRSTRTGTLSRGNSAKCPASPI